MKQSAKSILLTVLFGLIAAPAVFAAPYIEADLSPGLPERVANPGGVLTAECWVFEAGDPELLEVRLYDPNEVEIYYYPVPYATYYYMTWSPTADLPDGIYHYQVDYLNQAGESASYREGFLVLGQATTALCGFKFIDLDGDGIFDDGEESWAPGWEICTIPPLDPPCKITDEDGAACWFFIDPGTYEVCETLQPGFVNTTPLCVLVEVTDGQFGKAIFGNREAPVPVEESTWGRIKHTYR